MLGAWLHSFARNQRHLVLRGGVTICWTIWKTRNCACLIKKILMIMRLLFLAYVIILKLGASCRENKTEKTEEGVLKIKMVLGEAYALESYG